MQSPSVAPWLFVKTIPSRSSAFGFTVYSSMSQASQTGAIPFPMGGEQIQGGHAVVAAGYDDNRIIRNASPGGVSTRGAVLIRNSWGRGWRWSPSTVLVWSEQESGARSWRKPDASRSASFALCGAAVAAFGLSLRPVATPRRHLSMLRSYTAADALTIGNAVCGTIAIFLCLDYLATGSGRLMWTAFLLLPLALICDFFDGYVARLNRRRQSVMGGDLDSLADVISFGVAPAVLGFTLGLRGGWDMLCLTYFVVCGVSRLARFNVTASTLADDTGKVKYFEGTPIPTSIVIVAVLGMAFYLGRVDDNLWLGALQIGPALLHPLALIYAASGSAMISGTLRVPKP
jgi:CDP-diacylglycerol--serine O-phosphatidyltransferase